MASIQASCQNKPICLIESRSVDAVLISGTFDRRAAARVEQQETEVLLKGFECILGKKRKRKGK